MEQTQPRLAPADAFRYAAALSVLPAVAAAALGGGMPALILVVALGVTVQVYKHPEHAVIAGPVFLMACNVFLPASARFDYRDEIWQEYFWATGILFITLAAAIRTGWAAALELPRPLMAFLAVAGAASVYGLFRGNGPSFVLRQLFGLLLFVTYFALARHYGDETFFLKQTRAYGVPCVLAFVVYYVWVFGEYGLHKEISSLGTQASGLAILYAAGVGWKWRGATAAMLLAPLLLVERRALVAFVLGVLLIWALTVASLPRKILAWTCVCVLLLFSLSPPYVGMVLEALTGTSMLDQLLPNGARDATSIEDRGVQLAEAALIVTHSPIFGKGLGSELEWASATRKFMSQNYVDNGWAFVLVKMGLAGALTFFWFVVGMVRRMRRGPVALSASLLAMLLLVMFAEPVFFQFTTSPLLGAMAGLLYREADRAQPAA